MRFPVDGIVTRAVCEVALHCTAIELLEYQTGSESELSLMVFCVVVSVKLLHMALLIVFYIPMSV